MENAIIYAGSGAIRDAVVSMRGESDAQYVVAHMIYDDNVVPLREQKDLCTNHLVSRLPLSQYMCPVIACPTKGETGSWTGRKWPLCRSTLQGKITGWPRADPSCTRVRNNNLGGFG